jgi:hypothetical protein
MFPALLDVATQSLHRPWMIIDLILVAGLNLPKKVPRISRVVGEKKCDSLRQFVAISEVSPAPKRDSKAIQNNGYLLSGGKLINAAHVERKASHTEFFRGTAESTP